MELAVNTREILGKKVKVLRRQGITPAHLYGHNVDPVPLQCDTVQLKQVLARTGTTGLIELKLDKTKKPRSVMTREVQKDARTGELIHVDFSQVSKEEKIRVEVPIVTIGEAPALKHKENFLSHELDSVAVECLPDEIPTRFEVDISGLEEADQTIHVSDIAVSENITILTHAEQLIVKISAGFVEEKGAAAEADVETEAGAPAVVGQETAEETEE